MIRKTLAISLAAAAFGAPVAQAQSVPNTPQVLAAKAAEKGPESLRRFIQRTRMVYGLHFNDFNKPR